MNWLKSLVLVLPLLALSQAAPALAQTITDGESLRERCRLVQLTNPNAGRHCRGYIGAVADIMAAQHRVSDRDACPPAQTKREELIRVVKAWIREHPESLKDPAYRVVAQALSETYPCDGG